MFIFTIMTAIDSNNESVYITASVIGFKYEYTDCRVTDSILLFA